MAEPTFTAADFHNVVQKQIVNAVFETLVENKIDWELIAPFLDVARQMCRSEFQARARIRLHTVRAEGDEWVDAEEAFLGIAVAADPETAGEEDEGKWLSETYWLSDIATADEDPEQVRAVVRALERSIAKLNLWLAETETGGPAEAEPPV